MFGIVSSRKEKKKVKPKNRTIDSPKESYKQRRLARFFKAIRQTCLQVSVRSQTRAKVSTREAGGNHGRGDMWKQA